MKDNALFQASHMMILVTFSALLCALIAEDFLMGWEKWPLIPIVGAVGFSWYAHIQQRFSDKGRLTMYISLMMICLFFYGIHLTSMFDLALVMCAAMVLCTTTGIKHYILLCQLTYFVTFAYDILAMLRTAPEAFDALFISRSLLHVALIMTVGWLGRIIIDRWYQVLESTQDEVDQLTEATGRLNEFLTSVSHEIRTPINAVLGLSGICLERTEDDELRGNLMTIRAAGQRVAEQISDILDYSEIDRRRYAMNPEDYTLASLLHDLVMALEPYERPDVELVIDVDPAIPAVLNTDVEKLKKILWHLTTNALQYTKAGGVYMRLTAQPQTYGINLLISISDTGAGMTEQEIKRLFDGFYQAQQTGTRSSGGLGLGMAIVNGFVDALGGFIHIESAPGEGTTVRVCLPQKVVDATGCMTVEHPEQLVLSAFLNLGKFGVPAVRDYYNEMVRDIVRGLDVQMYRVDNLEYLRRLQKTVQLTHLFVGAEEYMSDVEYMERLAASVTVTVVANDQFVLPEGSRVRVMKKPFYCFPVMDVLNHQPGAAVDSRYMYCRGVRALVVDDEPLNLTVARDVFGRYGMEVVTAGSGPEAIELCNRETFDIVFMDLMMPGMDGIEAMNRIRSSGVAAWKSVPMVALTANAVSTAREAFREAGFDGFVAKPIDLMELERVMRAVLPKERVTFEAEPHQRGRRKKPVAVPAAKSPTKDEAQAAEPDAGLETQEAVHAAQAAADQTQDPYGLLREVGVDIDQGLFYCQRDDEFYQSLLAQFADEAPGKRTDMDRFFEGEDMPNYAILVHALKSTAKMLGANRLSDAAKALEMSAKAGQVDAVKAGHRGVMADYDALVAAINTALGDRVEDAEEEFEIIEFNPEEYGATEPQPGEVSGG